MPHWDCLRAVPRSCFLFQKVAGFEPFNFDIYWLGLTVR